MLRHTGAPALRWGVVVPLTVILFLFAEGPGRATVLNGSFEDSLANPYTGGTIPGWQVSGNMEYACIAQNTASYPCGPVGNSSTKFPATAAEGTRAYRNGANGDFPRDPNNPDETTNSIYDATWGDIVALNYNYLHQDVVTVPGATYLLQFQLQAMYALQPYYGFWVVIDQTPVANLSVRTQSDPTMRTDTANQWAQFAIPFTAAGASTEIGFASFVECNRHGCDIDLFVDNVILEGPIDGAAGVPEPGTLIAVPVGIALLIARRRLAG